jgi:hypothetical protein
MTDETSTPHEGSAAAPQLAGAARRTIRAVVNQELTEGAVRKLVKDALNLRGFAWAYCPTCKQKVQAEIPDVSKAVAALKKLMEQAEGRPVGEEHSGVKIIVRRPMYDRSLSEAVAEMQGIAAAAEVATRERLEGWLEQWAKPATSGA